MLSALVTGCDPNELVIEDTGSRYIFPGSAPSDEPPMPEEVKELLPYFLRDGGSLHSPKRMATNVHFIPRAARKYKAILPKLDSDTVVRCLLLQRALDTWAFMMEWAPKDGEDLLNSAANLWNPKGLKPVQAPSGFRAWEKPAQNKIYWPALPRVVHGEPDLANYSYVIRSGLDSYQSGDFFVASRDDKARVACFIPNPEQPGQTLLYLGGTSKKWVDPTPPAVWEVTPWLTIPRINKARARWEEEHRLDGWFHKMYGQVTWGVYVYVRERNDFPRSRSALSEVVGPENPNAWTPALTKWADWCLANLPPYSPPADAQP
jgi:hypothetical protein